MNQSLPILFLLLVWMTKLCLAKFGDKKKRVSTTIIWGHPSKNYRLISNFFTYLISETNNENESEQHVSILDCETGRVRRGYAQPNSYTDQQHQMQQNQLSPDLVQTRSNDLQTRSNQNRGLSPILFPPLSPPLSHRINVSTDSDEIPKLDPLACDINYFYDGLLEHKLLPAQGN